MFMFKKITILIPTMLFFSSISICMEKENHQQRTNRIKKTLEEKQKEKNRIRNLRFAENDTTSVLNKYTLHQLFVETSEEINALK